MKTSLIVNTACMDPLVRSNQNMYRATSYASRRTILHSGVLSWAHEEFDEVIVAGTFESGENYQNIDVEPRYRDRRDALYQREYGARHSTGDILVFCHDDHTPARGFAKTLKSRYSRKKDWDLLVPLRRHSLTKEILNNGKDSGYMGGHCLVMKRWLWAEVPWVLVDTEWWDTSMTRLWQEAGGKLLWVDDLEHLDLEALETET